jgi:hypothetical protein
MRRTALVALAALAVAIFAEVAWAFGLIMMLARLAEQTALRLR